MRRHQLKLVMVLGLGALVLAANAYAILSGALLPFYGLLN